MTINEIKDKIAKATAEMRASGPIHRRDLQKYVNRLKKQLRIYGGEHNG